MATLQQKIETARRQGYSDVQISTFLKQKGVSESEYAPILQQRPEREGVQQRNIGGFLQEELQGGADNAGFVGNIFQSTLGSRGLLGVAQQSGKAISAPTAIAEQTKVQDERGKIFDAKRQIVTALRNATDENQIERLRGLSASLDESLSELEAVGGNFDKLAPSVKENLGTTLNALATVAPAGRISPRGIALESGRGATFATGQALGEDRLPTTSEVATGAAIGAAVPFVNKAVSTVANKVGQIVNNVSRRLASGLGVSVDDIARNPKIAAETARQLRTGENTTENILKMNAESLTDDVLTFRRNLRASYGRSLEKLSATQVDDEAVKNAGLQTLKKYGIQVGKQGGFSLDDAAFSGDAIAKRRAIEVINRLNDVDSLDGKTLKQAIDVIDSKSFPNPGGNSDRLEFNAFIRDLTSSVRDTIKNATPELTEANLKFSQGMGLIEAFEKEFGKVKYGNIAEITRVSKGIEKALKAKGIAPEVIDDFLVAVGKDPGSFRATEAVRSAFANEPSAGAAGINPIEFVREVTAGILEPEDITRLTIFLTQASNLSESAVKPFVQSLANLPPVQRVALIRTLLEAFSGGQD